MIPILVGAAVSAIGIVAVVFVMRRKSVEKRSMYSARRSQIEHKVRAARERTLAPHGRPEKPPEAPPAPAPNSIFAAAPSPPQVTYEPSAYEPPPAAPPPEVSVPPEVPQGSPWEVGPSTQAPFGAPGESVPGQYPSAQPVPPEPTYAPPAEPAYAPAPSEQPVWTPATAGPAAPLEAMEPAVAAATPGSWSVVSESKESSTSVEDEPKKKGKKDRGTTSAWQLASGNPPDMDEGDEIKAPSPTVAIAQYAVFVVGLVTVLIGLFVMIANLPLK